ncbi:Uncharacterized protein FWK35_00002503 [Aphis craccivora]|uniref:Uncharacterized protein n=1 Tax=Aphis craccivora TaxID=307492 RepID=A0A6G0Z0M5_APHCR|nr:Uncharacterized protein FWK35_00002503 [Aphis craccivora]
MNLKHMMNIIYVISRWYVHNLRPKLGEERKYSVHMKKPNWDKCFISVKKWFNKMCNIYRLSSTTPAYRSIIIGCIRKVNSERSEECIDFTMIITSRNNAPISNYGGGFRCKSEYLWCIIEVKS